MTAKRTDDCDEGSEGFIHEVTVKPEDGKRVLLVLYSDGRTVVIPLGDLTGDAMTKKIETALADADEKAGE